LLCACAAPIGVERVSPRAAQRDLTQSVLTNGELSEKARILLRRVDREREWEDDPIAVLAYLHSLLLRPVTAFNAELRAGALDSLSELAFAYASESGDRRYYLAAALYAWLYLVPDDPALRPSALDRGVRLAADIYNHGLTMAFTDLESGEVVLAGGKRELPFGMLVVDLDEESLHWGNRELSHFVSLADLEVRGIDNRYRVSGLGAPLAARASAATADESDPIFGNVRVPVSALLSFGHLAAELPGGRFEAKLSVTPYSSVESTSVAGVKVPLEFEPTAAIALQLTESPPWQREIKGFFQGDLAVGHTGLVSLAPYHAGRIPVVLVHGTASSAGRWADLYNDLVNDSVLRRSYQFWLFTYNTGNPIAYSGWLLRKAIADLVGSLDPDGRDAALRDMVVMGHSQGGLLAKLLVVDSGDRFWNLVIDEPPDRVQLEPENRALLEGSLLVEPSPFVKRVIFLSTPHRGSRLASLGPARLIGRMVRAPANLVAAAGDLFAGDPESEVRRRLERSAGSIGNMSPSSRFIQALAALPIAPGIRAHSIIGVKHGPKEEGGDGVVSYQSAHLDDVDSELVVVSGHSSQSNPVVIGEVRRILVEHLEEAVAAGIVPAADLAIGR
jgi:pimeloyl-ACP methyl ester carboxylesterase